MSGSDPPPPPSRARRAAVVPTLAPEPPPPTSKPSSGPTPIASGPDLAPVRAPAPAPAHRSAEPVAGEATVRLTINGIELTVRKGTHVLEAAKLAGEEICQFCYHRGLSVAGNCRLCLVEIGSFDALQPSCQVEVAEGMRVRTQSPAVRQARAQVLEFTLKNHPVDCPVCEKAGECTLQRHYMDHHHAPTRVDVPKVRKPKRVDIGREILLDAERCILCSRCVRFCEEVPRTGELTMLLRGERTQVGIAEGHRLDNPYSVNVVDLCPVGALTAKDARLSIPAWQLSRTDTTCPGCATGCAVELHTRHETAYRVVPRHDPTVNGYWMCDEGRTVYKDLSPQTRVRQATVDGAAMALEEALQVTARRLEGKTCAVVFSSTATNEANLALAALADLLDAERFVLGKPRGASDSLLRDADKNPNTRGAHAAAGGAVTKHEAELSLELAGRAHDAVVFLDDEGEMSEVVRAGLGSLTSVVFADRRTALSDACTIVLPAASWAEVLGTYTNRQGRLRVTRPAWRPERDRTHRADLVRGLVLALGGRDIGTARDHCEALAEKHDDHELQDALQDPLAARPCLLRFANSRG